MLKIPVFSKIAVNSDAVACFTVFALISVSPCFFSCKERKGEASGESHDFSAEAALDQVKQLTGRRTVDDWHLAGTDYENEIDNRSDAARRGRDLWFLATGGNARFIHKTLAAKIGARIDWNRFLGESSRGRRFGTWGAINDPDCHAPRNEREKALGHGWDICPGDLGGEGLLSFIGKPAAMWDVVDPACKYRERDAADIETRGSPCDLAFGTSTGVVGWRKFPNPRFRAEQWTGWTASSGDHSIEPPFLVGAACAACHAGFDPENPPLDVEKPAWKNIHGLMGNRFLRLGPLIGSGLQPEDATRIFLEQNRPGTVLHFTEWAALGAAPLEPAKAIPLGVAVVFEGEEDVQQRMLRALTRSGVCFEKCEVKVGVLERDCARKCSSLDAFDRRLADLIQYTELVLSPELSRAMGISQAELIETKIPGGAQVWEEGRKVFSRRCSSCHSGGSVSGQADWVKGDILQRDIFARNREGHRDDVLSDGGVSTSVTMGSGSCSGPGAVHRHTSLLGLWSKAPLLQNRSIGSDVLEPSVASRLKGFESAMEVFLNSELRGKNILKTTMPLKIDAGIRSFNGDALSVLFTKAEQERSQVITTTQVIVPAGTPRELVRGLSISQWQNAKLNSVDRMKKLAIAASSPEAFAEVFGPWLQCIDGKEDKGHERYLPETKTDADALFHFLMTL